MRAVFHALGRNLVAGLRLALFMPVERVAFRISPTQLLLIVVLSAAIDIDADWVRAAHEARFSILGIHGEIFALGLLALVSAVLAIVRGDGELYLALPIVVLASFPLVQVIHVLPDLPRTSEMVSAQTKSIFEYAVLVWMFIIAMRAVYVCTDPIRGPAADRAILVRAARWADRAVVSRNRRNGGRSKRRQSRVGGSARRAAIHARSRAG